MKKRTDYAYVASRIDPNDPQNLGEYQITRRLPAEPDGYVRYVGYHYAASGSRRGRLVNRQALVYIMPGSQIHRSCMAAIARLEDEETQ